MQAQTTFLFSPDELKLILQESVSPLMDRISHLESLLGSAGQGRKHAYTVAEVAEQIGYSQKTVLSFIRKGKLVRGKLIKLNHKEPTNGDYRILPEDLDKFLSHF